MSAWLILKFGSTIARAAAWAATRRCEPTNSAVVAFHSNAGKLVLAHGTFVACTGAGAAAGRMILPRSTVVRACLARLLHGFILEKVLRTNLA